MKGPVITLAKELMERLKVPYNFTVFQGAVGEKIASAWTGVFERLEEWVRSIVVGFTFSLL